MSHPSRSAGSTVVQVTRKGPGEECAGCFLSFRHEHQQLGMWDARLWGTLGFALLLPLLPEWEMEAG